MPMWSKCECWQCVQVLVLPDDWSACVKASNNSFALPRFAYRDLLLSRDLNPTPMLYIINIFWLHRWWDFIIAHSLLTPAFSPFPHYPHLGQKKAQPFRTQQPIFIFIFCHIALSHYGLGDSMFDIWLSHLTILWGHGLCLPSRVPYSWCFSWYHEHSRCSDTIC